MIHDTFKFISEELSQFLKAKLPSDFSMDSGNEAPKPVAFVDISVDPPAFQNEAINILLLNLEEEKILRPPNPYIQLSKEGIENNVSPPLRLDVAILFAAKFSDYLNALKHLSTVIQFFQANRIFTTDRFPALPASIDKLVVELQSFTNTQKNEVWSSLKTAYLPSVIYQIKMMVFQEDMVSLDGGITEIKTQLNQR